MSHMDKLPEIFKEIMRHAKTRPDTSQKVVSITKGREVREFNHRKYELINAAEKYIADCKKDSR